MNSPAKKLSVTDSWRNVQHTSSLSRWVFMVQKELLEQARSFKLLWVPLVFIILGIMQPVSMHLMPLILEQAGNLPEGTVIEIPKAEATAVLAQTLSQFGTLGVLVLALVGMGTVSGERNSGSASLILVKPISSWSFISSKWTALLILSWGSLLAGYLASWYYTDLLFGEVSVDKIVSSFLVYGLWLTIVISFTVMFSTLLRSPAGAAFSALGGAFILSILASLFPKQLGWSPGALSGFSYQLLTIEVTNISNFIWAIAVAVLFIFATLAASVWQLLRSKAVD